MTQVCGNVNGTKNPKFLVTKFVEFKNIHNLS